MRRVLAASHGRTRPPTNAILHFTPICSISYSDLLQENVLGGFARRGPGGGCDASRQKGVGLHRPAALRQRLLNRGGNACF
jgi:hypothetical protein